MKLHIWGLGYLINIKRGKGTLDGNILSYFNQLSKDVDQLNVWLALPKNVEKVSLPGFNVHFYGLGRISVVLSGLRLLFKSIGQDVYLFMPAASRIAIFVPFYKVFCKSLTIYLADDPFALVNAIRLSRFPFMKEFYIFLIKTYLKSANKVIVRGKFLKQLASKYNSNIHVTTPITELIYYNANLKKYSVEKKQDFNFVTLGRLTWEKGFNILLISFAKFLNCHKHHTINYYLIIAGDGPDRNAIRNLANELGISSNVQLIGWVSTIDDKKAFWASADVHVLPTINTEGVPRCIDEAIINLVPSIASAIGGIPLEFNKGEVHLIRPNCEEDLFSAMCTLTNSDKRDNLIKLSAARREYFLSAKQASTQHFEIISCY
jgi:glycosyltransferase involved in cell wall biosynthesis